MKNYSFNLIFCILIVLSILFGTFIWEKITIPFNDNMIVGEYSDKKFNPTNDILRYLAFIFLPIIIFFSHVYLIGKLIKIVIVLYVEEISIKSLKLLKNRIFVI